MFMSKSLHAVDFSRHQGLLDRDLMQQSHVAIAGCGGAASLVEDLTRCGIGAWTLVDFDRVSAFNIATQGVYTSADSARARAKAEVLAERVSAINPSSRVTPVVKRYQELSEAEHAQFWSANLVLGMTDDFATQCLINSDAIKTSTDALFAICYIGCGAGELTATFPEAIAAGRGCHRCHTKARYDAYEHGFQNPTLIASHALAASYLNAPIGLIVLSRIHERGGSALPVTQIAREFAQRPCLISRIIPSFGTGPGEAFAGLPEQAFTTRLFPLDTPSDWVCPDCGTRGVLDAADSLQRPIANRGSGTTEGASQCAVPCNLAVFADPRSN